MGGDFSYEMEFCFNEPMSRNQFCGDVCVLRGGGGGM